MSTKFGDNLNRTNMSKGGGISSMINRKPTESDEEKESPAPQNIIVEQINKRLTKKGTIDKRVRDSPIDYTLKSFNIPINTFNILTDIIVYKRKQTGSNITQGEIINEAIMLLREQRYPEIEIK